MDLALGVEPGLGLGLDRSGGGRRGDRLGRTGVELAAGKRAAGSLSADQARLVGAEQLVVLDELPGRGGLLAAGALILTRVLTVPLTRAFRAQLPEARVSISEGLSTQMQEWLVDGRLDIAVLYNARASADIDISPLLDEELLLVQPRQPGLAEDPPPGPITLAEVAALPLVIPSRPNAVRTHVETEMAQIGCRMQVALEIDGVSAILDLVADGAGAALLSRNAVASCIRPSAYQVRAVCDPPLRTRLFLAVSSMRPTTLTQHATLDLIRSTLAEVGK